MAVGVYTRQVLGRAAPSTPLRCPDCDSVETLRTSERLGEQTYLCRDCDHVWPTELATRPGSANRNLGRRRRVM